MVSRYLDWSPDRIAKEIKAYEKAIRDYKFVIKVSAVGSRERDNAIVHVSKWEKTLDELRDCLKPKVDYEDGSWV